MVSYFQKASFGFGSHVSDNDPEVLEKAKERQLKGVETHLQNINTLHEMQMQMQPMICLVCHCHSQRGPLCRHHTPLSP
jgi:hypothetical protein